MTATVAAPANARVLAERFVRYLETGQAPPGLLDPEVFLDFTMPRWRLQAQGRNAALDVRRSGHPQPGTVPRWRYDPTPTGFVLEVEEVWDDDVGEHWYCRELFRADVGSEGISELAVYCTGDWDTARRREHAAAVHLIRP